jgi:Holliday junction resolvasome RuvABC endonuclease subunit
VERIVDRYQPDAILLEAFELPAGKRITRIRHLCRSLMSFAQARAIDVTIYSRAEIQAVFVQVGAASRYEIACVIAQRLDALRTRLPKKRATWEGESPAMALFNAAAVGLTHYHRADGARSV